MAFKLDNDLLEELGLAALSADEKQAMLRQILETLEMRVGTTLASRMSDTQLDEFERLMPAEGDNQGVVQQKEQQALQWLESNFPNYKQVVNDELEKLKSEIKQSAPQIVAASQQAGLPPAAPAQPQPDNFQPPVAPPAPMAPPTDFTQPAQPQFDQAPASMPPAMPPSQPAAPYQPQEPSMSGMPSAPTQPANDYTAPTVPANPYQPPDPYQQPSAAPSQGQPFNPPSTPYAPPTAPTDNPSSSPSQQPPFAPQ